MKPTFSMILAVLALVASGAVATPAVGPAASTPSPRKSIPDKVIRDAPQRAGSAAPADNSIRPHRPPAAKVADHPPAKVAAKRFVCGPYGCSGPTGALGLEYNDYAYRALCAPHYYWYGRDSRPRACFDTGLRLEYALSAPHPDRLYGYIGGSDTDFVLFAGQTVTFDDRLEIHVEEASWEDGGNIGCTWVSISHRDGGGTSGYNQLWCPGRDGPIGI